MTMERSQHFIKTVGPLPTDLGVAKGGMFSRTHFNALSGLEVCKSDGAIYKTRASQLTSQLNAGDRVASIFGVPLRGEANHAFFDQVACLHLAGREVT